MKLIFIFVFFLFHINLSKLFAKEVRHLVRSPRALLMGDAYTSLVEDEYILFYNPAAIGKTFGVYLTPLNVDLGVTNFYDDQAKFKNLPKTAPGIASRFMGYPIYLHAGYNPGFRFGPFAFNYYLSNTSSMVMHNIVHPFIDIDYRYDRGFTFGFAYTIGKSAKKNYKTKKKTTPTGRRTSFGFSTKFISRESIAENISLYSTTLLNQIATSGGDTAALKRALGFSKGDGWGGDLGIEHAITHGSTELTAAFSILDVANTRINRHEGTRKIPVQEMSVNSGISFKQDFTILDYSFSLDLHPLNQNIDFMRKLHMGFQLGLPLVRAYAGLSEGYVSYGLGLRLWPIEILAGVYSVELGTKYKDQQGKRALIYINLLDFSFDVM